jgi:hypothetical protein
LPSFRIALVTPAFTITNGQPDGNAHPYVGLGLQLIPGTDLTLLCSGSALSPTVFLTAAHCFDRAQPVFVFYGSSLSAPDLIVSVGFLTPHPDWCNPCDNGLPGFDSHDVGVVRLLLPVDPGEFATLPSEGLADTLAMMSPVSVVGFGAEGIVRGGGTPVPQFTLRRLSAPSLLVQSNQSWAPEFLKLTANPGGGNGGVCFGDSGGPNVLEGSGTGNDVVVAINSYASNDNCAGVTYSQRIDLESVLEFIGGLLE